MSRTISQLSPGTVVWLYETVEGNYQAVKYIYLGLDIGGNALLLRDASAVSLAMNSTNIASYNGSVVDLFLENDNTGFLARLDEDTRGALQMTTILYRDHTQSADGSAQVLSVARRCFLLSAFELGFGGVEGGMNYLPAMKIYYNTTSDSTARLLFDNTGNGVRYWTRSGGDETHFILVAASGSSALQYANYTNAVRPVLSFKPETPVSDVGAENIFLLPDSHRTCWQISFVASLGESARRPIKGKLFVPAELGAEDTLECWVCNNFADSAPTWIPCPNNDVAAFGVEKTSPKWEVGVKVEAQLTSPGRMIYEPAMIVETEAPE